MQESDYFVHSLHTSDVSLCNQGLYTYLLLKKNVFFFNST